MPDVAIKQAQVASSPAGYTVPGAQEIVLKSVKASFDGTGASGNFVPLLQLVEPGGTVMVECPASVSVAAGGSADVSWFPGLAGTTGGGGGPTGKAQIRVPVVSPDNSSWASPALSTANGFTNVRIVLPELVNGHDSFWTGTTPIPQNYSNTPQIIIQSVTQATTGVVRWIVSSSVVAAGASEDAAWTDETAQNITVPGTAFVRQDTTFSLSTVPVAGSSLNIKITRNGANVADTCAQPAFIWECIFQFNVG